MARNYCIDHYRASKREKEVVVEDLVAFDLAPAVRGSNPHRGARGPRPPQLPAARASISLPEKLREAVVLRDLQGLSYQEMAERLALPEGTVKSRINRGREELSRLLLRAQQPERRDGRAAAGAAAHAEVTVMQLRVEQRATCTIVRVQEAKLTYPILSAFFAEVRQLVEGGTRKLLIDLAGGELHRQRLHRLPDGHPPAAAGAGAARSSSAACSRGWRR